MNRITQRSPLLYPISARGGSLVSLVRSHPSVCSSHHKGSVDGAAFNQTLEAKLIAFRKSAPLRVARLTPRQNQVLDLILAGYPSKNIALDLCISQRTVENHRAAIAQTTGAKSLPALVHTAVCARCSLNNQSKGQHEATSSPTLTGREADWNTKGIASGRATPCLPLSSNRHLRVIEDIEYSASENNVASPILQDSESIRIDMKEVQHRVKNMVAIIQSISHQTMRHCTTKQDFDERFSTRLSAFCRSLDCLIANEWRGIDIHDLVHLQLTAFGSVDGSQISVNGPQVHLTPAAAHNLGLALHELATNAVKHGALSVPQGRVALNWKLAHIDGRQRFHMTWSEFGGPLVTQPTHAGFGRQMIEQLTALALAGKATYEFLAKGVRWSIDIPGSSLANATSERLPPWAPGAACTAAS